MKPFYVTANVLLVIGEQQVELCTGDVVDLDSTTLPRGKVQSLVNTRGLVPQEEYERMFSSADRRVEPPAAPEAALDDEADGEEEAVEIPAWQQTPVASLGLRPEAVIAYQGAGLTTVRDLLVYGQKHGGLATLRGIGESTEKATVAAIEKLMPKTEGEQTTN